jgi:uncharacterized protein YkwD
MKKEIIFIILGIVLILLAAAGSYLVLGYISNKNQTKSPNSSAVLQPGALTGPSRTQQAPTLAPDEIIKWTNYYRQQNGLKPLEENIKLTQAAQNKVNDMFNLQYFAHTSPSGKDAGDLAKEVGYNYKSLGENLALGDFMSEKELVDAWMNSPGHRANILNKDFTQIGVATGLNQYKDRKTWLAVQEFGKPMPNCTKPDENLKKQIETNESQYSQINSLNQQISTLSSQGNALVQQGNAKIEQGNQIYAQTGDKSQAQPYWDEGKSLQDQGQAKLSQASQLQTQVQNLQTLYNENKTLIEQYNSQIQQYNSCINS